MAHKVAASTSATVHALEVVAIPTYTYTGLIGPTAEGIDVILSEANVRLQELPDVEGRAVYGVAGEELAAFGDEVDMLVVGSRGSARSAAWCSAAQRTTSSATHAVRCSSCTGSRPKQQAMPRRLTILGHSDRHVAH